MLGSDQWSLIDAIREVLTNRQCFELGGHFHFVSPLTTILEGAVALSQQMGKHKGVVFATSSEETGNRPGASQSEEAQSLVDVCVSVSALVAVAWR